MWTSCKTGRQSIQPHTTEAYRHLRRIVHILEVVRLRDKGVDRSKKEQQLAQTGPLACDGRTLGALREAHREHLDAFHPGHALHRGHELLYGLFLVNCICQCQLAQRKQTGYQLGHHDTEIGALLSRAKIGSQDYVGSVE